MRYFAEIRTIGGEHAEVTLRIKPDVNTLEAANDLAYTLACVASGLDLPPCQSSWSFWNDACDGMSNARAASYGEQAQAVEGVFVL